MNNQVRQLMKEMLAEMRELRETMKEFMTHDTVRDEKMEKKEGERARK